MAATSGAGGLDLSRKLGPLPVWVWAAVGIGLALFLNKKKAGGSSSSAGGTGYSSTAQDQAAALAAGGLSSLYPMGYSNYSSSSDLASVLQQLNNEVTSLGGGKPGTSKSPAPTPGNTGRQGASGAFNPYTLGTTVAPGEKIVQVIPVGTRGYIDVTSLGGLYGVGLNVSGSAYDPNNKGSYSARVSGNKIYEYTPTGIKVYSIK